MLPTHTDYLIDWFATHPDLVNEDDFPWLLRGYGIRYVLLHMGNTPTEPMSRLATGTADLKAVGCFEAVSGPPWDYPICVLEVTPPVSPAINVHMAGNWPEAEEWGIWAMGRKSRIRWISTNGKEDHFVIEAFPHCIEGQPQQMDLVVDEQIIASHHWDSCDSWRGVIAVPEELVQVGWNEMTLNFAQAERPVDVTGGQNPDTRELSVGFTRFELMP